MLWAHLLSFAKASAEYIHMADADELAAVAAAVGSMVGSMSDGGSSEAMGESGIHDFYVTLLDHAQASIECAADPEACPDPEDLVAEAARLPSPPAKRLDFASFVRLMTSKAVSEYKTPEKELLPAFEALDANGDGVITREEMLQAMEVVGRNLPNLPGESFAQKAATAFDALDRDKSGALDCTAPTTERGPFLLSVCPRCSRPHPVAPLHRRGVCGCAFGHALRHTCERARVRPCKGIARTRGRPWRVTLP